MNSEALVIRLHSVWSRCEQAVTTRTRRQMARDLHDGLTQDIYATNLALSVLKDRLPAEFRGDVERLIDRQVTMITSVRELVHRTETPVVAMNLTDMVEHLVRIARRELATEPYHSVSSTAPRAFSFRLAHHAGFALREMISNAVRHSQGSRVEATIEITSTALVIQVVDNGVGLDAYPTTGRGLANLRSRARTCGGRFQLTSHRGCGSTATWSVPLPPPEHDERLDSWRDRCDHSFTSAHAGPGTQHPGQRSSRM